MAKLQAYDDQVTKKRDEIIHPFAGIALLYGHQDLNGLVGARMWK